MYTVEQSVTAGCPIMFIPCTSFYVIIIKLSGITEQKYRRHVLRIFEALGTSLPHTAFLFFFFQ